MRKTLVVIHLLIASLVAPAFLLVATSGGLYLLGFKGSVVNTPIELVAAEPLNFESKILEAEVRNLLKEANIAHEFEYLKNQGSLIQTRPTSRTYIEFRQTDDGLLATWNEPSLQKRLIELHKGHGPRAFKTYQKFVAAALLGSVISGLWMGLASPALRRKTLLAGTAGLLVFLYLAFG